MNDKIVLAERTFHRGTQQWRVDSAGNWSVYMWGWWPSGANPRGQFMPIEKNKVPKELICYDNC